MKLFGRVDLAERQRRLQNYRENAYLKSEEDTSVTYINNCHNL